MVTITTTGGDELTEQLDYPKGDPRNPLTDQEIEEKFDALASPVLSDGARGRLKDAVWKLDKLDSVSALMEMCKADIR
jgi:2-methylcitrate dehydratase